MKIHPALHVKKISQSLTAAAVLTQLSAASVLAAPPAPPGGGGRAGTTPVSPPSGFFANIGVALGDILTFVFIISVLLVFFYILWGGITWITSGGEKGKTEEARNKITAAVIGLIILLASFAITQLVIRFFAKTDINGVLQLTA